MNEADDRNPEQDPTEQIWVSGDPVSHDTNPTQQVPFQQPPSTPWWEAVGQSQGPSGATPAPGSPAPGSGTPDADAVRRWSYLSHAGDAHGQDRGYPPPGGSYPPPPQGGGGYYPPVPPYGSAPQSSGPYGPTPYGSAPYGSGSGQYGGAGGYTPPPWIPSQGQQGPTPPRHKGRTGLVLVVLAAVLIAASIGGLIGHSILTPTRSSLGTGSNTPSTTTPSNTGPFGGLDPFGSSGNGSTGTNNSNGSGPSDSASIAAKVDPGLVDVNTSIDYGEAQGAGTGIVLTSDGLVLTNNHVVEGATSFSVRDIGNDRTYSAKVLGYDRNRDVALIQLIGASGLKTASLGSSSSIQTGDKVVAVGNANGAGGTPSYAGGTITGLNQSITASDEFTGSSEQLSGMLQTNANIIPGDSGGPLVNSSGQVIGMDTAGSSSFRLSTQATQGYAVPIDAASTVAHLIRDNQETSAVHIGPTAFLGVQVESGSSSLFGGGSAKGADVAGVVTGGPAASAGIAQGDVITSVDGHAITSTNALTQVLVQDEKPGTSVAVVYTNTSGQSQSAMVTLASGPAQ